ncbi:Hypothetical protein A7982_10476 [Minicystis rosea]|nr:Hypothetical protein A7982_10476 [Minicystis rosea]
MRHVRPTPLGAVVRGLAAGAVGSAAQDLFFRATAAITPETPQSAFSPPEAEQREETATQTVARRTVECMMQRHLAPESREASGVVVHYAFGAALGAAYGLLRESAPVLRGPLGAAAYGLGAWVVGDDIVLPAFRLSAGPTAYPLKTHAYAIAAHLVFGAAVAAAYEAMRPRSLATAAAMLWAVRAKVALEPKLPAKARPFAGALVESLAKMRAARPLATIADAARAA